MCVGGQDAGNGHKVHAHCCSTVHAGPPQSWRTACQGHSREAAMPLAPCWVAEEGQQVQPEPRAETAGQAGAVRLQPSQVAICSTLLDPGPARGTCGGQEGLSSSGRDHSGGAPGLQPNALRPRRPGQGKHSRKQHAPPTPPPPPRVTPHPDTDPQTGPSSLCGTSKGSSRLYGSQALEVTQKKQ